MANPQGNPEITEIEPTPQMLELKSDLNSSRRVAGGLLGASAVEGLMTISFATNPESSTRSILVCAALTGLSVAVGVIHGFRASHQSHRLVMLEAQQITEQRAALPQPE